MTTKDAICYLLESNKKNVHWLLSDLTDEELLVRPTPGANHIAWQMGHLITSEGTFFLPKVPGGEAITLPEGFAAAHASDRASSDSAKDFFSKEQYLDLYDRARAATLAALDRLSEADLDKSSGHDYFSTVGKVLITIGNHDMMHAGQFTVVRRKLGKPVLF